ncbi:MAG: hypothetical protein PWP04_543 [Candidatus Atribacteria bacterium]|nr:hypothetical protein [Candidatus Atribacteria bacterium]
MPVIEIQPSIYWIGVNDHTTDLFEGIWPITQEGVSYNSYLIDGEKKVLIDLAKSIKADQFFRQISEICEISQLDYIVLNHMEPDHTGTLGLLWKLAPQATILCTPQAQPMVESFYGITERVQPVDDGETINLGQLTLKFFHTPFVHWPETMMTYETSSRTLFSCDAFGSYGALSGTIFDDQLNDFDFYLKQALRYYVNIVAKFSSMVTRAIQKLADIPIKIIAPSHGLIWKNDPQKIVDLYQTWARLANGKGDRAVTLVYGSMYGNTEEMMDAVAQGVAQAGIPVEIFDLRRTHFSYILPALWLHQGVIIGAPTYETALFPLAVQLLDLCHRKAIKNKKVAYFGSFGWSGGGQRELEKWATELKWELTDTLVFRGAATLEDLKKGQQFGREFAKMLKEDLV